MSGPQGHDDQIGAAQQKLNMMRAEMRGLHKKRKRMDSSAVWAIPDTAKQQAVVLFLLSNDASWSVRWIQRYHRQYESRTLKQMLLCTDAQIHAWAATWGTSAEVTAMMTNLEHPTRVALDIFLMESLIFEFIQSSNKKGIAVPSNSVMAKYIKAWTYRYTPVKVSAMLEELKVDANKRRQWLRGFRTRWSIAWGTLKKGKPLTRQELQQKVSQPTLLSGTAYNHTELSTKFVLADAYLKAHVGF